MVSPGRTSSIVMYVNPAVGSEELSSFTEYQEPCDKDKLYSKRFQAQQEENELIEKRNILEGKYGNLIDKNGKRGKKYSEDIAKLEKDIHDSKFKQWGIR